MVEDKTVPPPSLHILSGYFSFVAEEPFFFPAPGLVVTGPW